MSGLVGWIDFQLNLPTQEKIVLAMLETIRHRGPDHGDSWISAHAALGYRKLALNSSDNDSLLNRITTTAGEVIVIYDGRFYNSIELRQELETQGYAFSTGSDAELLLKAFLCWGEHCVDRFNGMYAFVIWDGRQEKLWLGRDRLGIKPLYYFSYRQGILVASEPKAIMANPLFQPSLELSALPILLQPRLALPGETPLAGLCELPPAHMACFSRDGLCLRRYWHFKSAEHTASFEETAQYIRSLMEDIINRQTPANMPCSIMLSGGVDSTSVAALVMQTLRKQSPNPSLASFCLQFIADPAHFISTELRPEIDAPYAELAANYIGSRHNTITVSLDELFAAIPITRHVRDLPGWGQFDASMYLLFKAIQRNYSVALTGEAADEIFGGYPYYFKPDLIQRDHFPWLGHGPKLIDYLSPKISKIINPQENERRRYAKLISEAPKLEGEEPINARMREVLYLGMMGPLAVILDRQERMSAAAGLEMRFPFCDHRLLEYMWNVPWKMKTMGGIKGLFKAALKDILPQAILARRKSAYPHVQNPLYDQHLVQLAQWIINHRDSRLKWMFDTAKFNHLIEQICDGPYQSSLPGGASSHYLLIQLIEMHQWIENYQVSLPKEEVSCA